MGGILSYEAKEEDDGDLETEEDSFPSESNQLIVTIIYRATLEEKQGSSTAEISKQLHKLLTYTRKQN